MLRSLCLCVCVCLCVCFSLSLSFSLSLCLSEISLSLTHDAAVVLVHTFVTSRVDHCCSILAGLPSGLISRLDHPGPPLSCSTYLSDSKTSVSLCLHSRCFALAFCLAVHLLQDSSVSMAVSRRLCCPSNLLPAFCRLLKSSLFSRGWAGSASE